MRCLRLRLLSAAVALIAGISLYALVAQSVLAQSTPETDCSPSQFTEWRAPAVVTPGDPNRVRAEPSTSAREIGRVFPGDPFNILPTEPVCVEGYLWREIQTATLRGWTVEVSADGGDPFIVPYTLPEPRAIGVSEDGAIRMDENGIRFTVPAGLNITGVTTQPEVGLFGDVMGERPNAAAFVFTSVQDGAETTAGSLSVYASTTEETRDYWSSALGDILAERPPLLEYAARNRMPQLPVAGAAALFGGAPAYLPFGSGDGLRYITTFAQTSVRIRAENTYAYLYRGLTADGNFLIAAQFDVRIPQAAIPPWSGLEEAAYAVYLRQLETNLAAQPTSAFTPDLALLDALFASLTLTDEAVFSENLLP